jgi:hypothetical protein
VLYIFLSLKLIIILSFNVAGLGRKSALDANYLVLFVFLEILARLLLQNQCSAGQRGGTVPGESGARGTCRGHGQGVEVPVEQIPVAAIMTVITRTQLYVLQTERISLVRRRRHLDFTEKRSLLYAGFICRAPTYSFKRLKCPVGRISRKTALPSFFNIHLSLFSFFFFLFIINHNDVFKRRKRRKEEKFIKKIPNNINKRKVPVSHRVSQNFEIRLALTSADKLFTNTCTPVYFLRFRIKYTT